MFYKKELDFLIKLFTKRGISIKVLPAIEFAEEVDIIPSALYKLTDVLGLHYNFLLLPETDAPTLLLIGPYETSDVTAETSSLMTALDIFCETIWGENSNFREIVIDGELKKSFSTLSWEKENTDGYIFAYTMRQMESKYSYENEMLKAVTAGHSHKADIFFPDTEKEFFEKRIADSLRNSKNYLIIMNTLCRKAAEKGGVHPLFLDKTSSEYALKIEQLTSTKDIQDFIRQIFKTYCKLVKNHNTKPYSRLVQNVILYIESNLNADLSLSTLASLNNVSSSYLSTLFRKDVGTNLTNYVNSKRMENAQRLLEDSNSQIQVIAQNCGYLDVQYFSKLFKRYTGSSPQKYREQIRKEY